MKQTARKTRSATHLKKSERVEIVIKKENDNKTNFSQQGTATPSVDPIVKAEENEIDLKSQVVKDEEEKGFKYFAESNWLRKLLQSLSKRFSTKHNYHYHIKTALHKRLVTRTPVPRGALPDEFDPNNYCIVCHRTYLSKVLFSTHLRRKHRISRKARRNSDIRPDINDPNFYCNSCQYSYKSRAIYREHLKNLHQMELIPLVKQPVYDSTISVSDTKNPKNTSYIFCRRKYNSRRSYRGHMLYIHKDTTRIRRTAIITNTNVQPDPNNPTFYCVSCQHTYSSKFNYRLHMLAVHPSINMERSKIFSATNPLMIEVDAGNHKNTMCTLCGRDYADRNSYRTHMRIIHKESKREPAAFIGRLKKLTNMDPNIVPIWNDPNYYCPSCKRAFSTKSTYHSHIKNLHDDILEKSKQISTTANPTQSTPPYVKTEEN